MTLPALVLSACSAVSVGGGVCSRCAQSSDCGTLSCDHGFCVAPGENPALCAQGTTAGSTGDGGDAGPTDAGPTDAGPIDGGGDGGFSCPGQLLADGTFDDGGLGSWFISGTAGAVVQDAHSGPFAAQLCPEPGEPQLYMSDRAVDSNPLPVGATYHATGFYKGVIGATGELKLRENQGATIINDASDDRVLDGGWQRFDISYTVQGSTSDHVNVIISAKPADAGCMNVDDVCVIRVQ